MFVKLMRVTESLLSINATTLSNDDSGMERIFNKSVNFEKNPSISNLGITKIEEPPINFALKNMVDVITTQDQDPLYNFVIKKEVNLEGAESLVPSERTTTNAMSVYEADPFKEFVSNKPSCENTEAFRSISTKIINAANLSNDEAMMEGIFSKPADFEMAQPPISSKSAKIAIEDEEPIINFSIKNEVEDQDPLLNFVIKKEVDLREFDSSVPTTSATLSEENYSRCTNKDTTPAPEIPTDLAAAIKNEPIESEKARENS